MNRRNFFGVMGGAVAALTLDPERALWVPGKKLISIPNPQRKTLADFMESGELVYLTELHSNGVKKTYANGCLIDEGPSLLTMPIIDASYWYPMTMTIKSGRRMIHAS